MLQLEVVQRMVAKHSTPDYGRLSVMLQTRFAMKKLFNVAPGAFRPPPKVDSAVVRLAPLAGKPDYDQALFEKIVREAFSARRKTLRNALPLRPGDYEELGIDPMLRPENLSPADYLRISARITSRGAR
jgi:16S rRNA (adenine1518-N6/adenine1519-N6)-dimethyltransferase